MPQAVHLRVRIRAGKTRARFLNAVKLYADERPGRPWEVARRTREDFVLKHASGRAGETSYRFSKSGENAREVRVRVTGS